MYSKITTAGICGVDSFLAYVEVDVSKGMPYLEMVGLLSSEVREARERVRVALKNSNIEIKPLKITVNISPASIRKEGAAYDLPIAIGILVSLGFLSQEMIKDTLIIGELGLDGRIKGVNGVLPIINNGKQHGIKTVILPFDNIAEATLVEDIEYIAMEYLEELISYLTSNKERRNFIQREKKKIIQTMMLEKERERESVKEEKEDLSDVLGQECLKRAALIAAAGFHNLLIIGPPGSGKTMIAKRIPSILPSLTKEEQIEITSVYSVAGLLKEGEFIMKERPYKNPHHSITCQALSGGGRNPKPGILSLCHKGVLFLDEFPEYKRETIECLRQPLEEKSIQITRCNGAYTYPADIMLVAAMNACPCGYYPDLTKCNCSEQEIRKYRSRISGPILDRLDMCVTAQKMQYDLLSNCKKKKGESILYKELVEKARTVQAKRFKQSVTQYNSQMTAKEIVMFCQLEEEVELFYKEIFETMELSVRAYHSVLKVARTIADLEEEKHITKAHLCEAICYKGMEA